MFGTLLKKQLYEVFQGYFYNSKKNKARSKAATAGWFVFFAVIMVGVLGGMFTMLSYALSDLGKAGYSWFYFAIMGMLSIMLGVFGSVFNTYAGLYCAKDNDLLLSMPIPLRHIISARLMNVYIMGLMYSAVVIIPAVIVHMITVKAGLLPLIGGIMMMLEISLICLILSCLLGWLVAKVSTKLKNKSIVTVFISILFIGGYYFFYFKAQEILKNIVMNAALYGEKIKGYAYPLYVWGSGAQGDIKATLISILVIAALLIATWFLIARSFLSLATSTGAAVRKTYKEKKTAAHSASHALLVKEFARFTGSANYMLNCGLGILLLPISGIALLIKGDYILEMMGSIMGDQLTMLCVVLPAAIVMLSSMNDMAAPSVSLEGKNLWLVQSFPVHPWMILKAKLQMQLILTEIPALFCGICAFFIMPGTVLERLLGLAAALLMILLDAMFCMMIGILMPNLSWTNEIAPIKQSLGVFLSMLAGFLFAAAFGGLYIWQGWKIGVTMYLIICMVLTAILTAVLYRWLRTKGAKRVAEL